MSIIHAVLSTSGVKKLLHAEVPKPVRWAVFIIFTALWLLWFGGYFGF